MRIVIDGRMLSWTGVGRYTLGLLDGLAEIDETNDYVVLMRSGDWAKWEPKAGNFQRVECDIAAYTLAEQTALPRFLARLGPDVVHLTTPNAAAAYRGRKVVTVHDLTLLDFDTSRGSLRQRLTTRLKRFPFRRVLVRQLRTATRVVTATDYVQRQLVERLAVDPRRISTVPLAVSGGVLEAAEEPFTAAAGSDLALLYAGNYYPFKNVGLLIEALAMVSATRPDAVLVLAGPSAEFKAGLVALAERLGVADRVIMPGFVSDGQLTWLYRHCRAYVNPSLSEGFGLQGLEAMAHGLPVLSSTATCLPEVYGDAALYFDPHDARELADRIVDLIADPGLAADLTAKGHERLKTFSWRRTAELTHQAYEEARQ